jgi:uncharacterized OsmC-like protein
MNTLITLLTIASLAGCSTISKPKYCYEMTINLNGTSKQVICSKTPLHESQSMRRLS